MAILIPSKNIYNADNDKVMDNAIKTVQVSVKDTKVVADSNTIFYDKTIDSSDVGIFPNNVVYDRNSPNNTVVDIMHQDTHVVFCGVRPIYKSIQFDIPKYLADDIWIPDGFELLSNIWVSSKNIKSSKYIGDINATFSYGATTGYSIIKVTYYSSSNPPVFSSSVIDNIPLVAERFYNTSVTGDPFVGIQAFVQLDDETTFTLTETEDKYTVNGNVLCGCVAFEGYARSNGQEITKLSGSVTEYRPENLQIVVEGGTYKLTIGQDIIEKSTNPNATENDNIISLPTNSLIQSRSVSNLKEDMDIILAEYGNGKETASILCDISDYYNENNHLIISAKTEEKMSFEMYDEVVPFIKHATNIDMPMSTNLEGKAKVFTVLGSEILYDGAVWQRLTLQESGTIDKIFHNGSRDLRLSYDSTIGGFVCNGIDDPYATWVVLPTIANGTTVKAIGKGAFNNDKFQRIYFLGTEESWNSIELGEENSSINENSVYFYSESRPKVGGNYWHYVNGVPKSWSSLVYYLSSDGLSYSVGSLADQETDVYIPETYKGFPIVSIDPYAFWDNGETIRSIHIPSTINAFASGIFSNCLNLSSIVVDSNNSTYCSINGNLYSKDKKTLLQYALGKIDKEFIIPNSVETIGDTAFLFAKNINSVIFGENVATISYSAFAHCPYLSNVVFNERLSVIGESAFEYCQFTFIKLPESVTIIGKSAFGECYYLTNVTFEGTPFAIMPSAFVSARDCDFYVPWSNTELQENVPWGAVNSTIHYNSKT